MFLALAAVGRASLEDNIGDIMRELNEDALLTTLFDEVKNEDEVATYCRLLAWAEARPLDSQALVEDVAVLFASSWDEEYKVFENLMNDLEMEEEPFLSRREYCRRSGFIHMILRRNEDVIDDSVYKILASAFAENPHISSEAALSVLASSGCKKLPPPNAVKEWLKYRRMSHLNAMKKRPIAQRESLNKKIKVETPNTYASDGKKNDDKWLLDEWALEDDLRSFDTHFGDTF